MPKFLSKTLVFLILLISVDFVIGSILKKFYFKQASGWLYRTTFSLETTKADLLIFGASRANHHYHPAVYNQQLGISTYNTGRDGNGIFYHYAILQGVLKRYTPKVAILDISRGEFMKSRISYERLSSLLPYYETHPELRSIIALRGPYERLKLASAIYPFNSLVFQIVAGNSSYNKTRANRNDENGYVPLFKTWEGNIAYDSSFQHYEIDSAKLLYFRKFVKDCKDAGVKLYVFVSPCYVKFKGEDQSLYLAKQIALRNNIPYNDFSEDPVFFTDPSIYADESHLNDSGARLYSNMVIRRMKQDTILPEKIRFAVKNIIN